MRHQNAWPSPEHDALSFLDRMDRVLPVGFYYKTLIKPKFLWHLAEPIIRRLAGLGKVDPSATDDTDYQHLNLFTDVAVVGGGPAGCSAAAVATKEGLRVVLIDDQPTLGGHLRSLTRPDLDHRNGSGTPGHELARRLAGEVQGLPNLTLLSDATAYGLYEGGLLGVHSGSELIKLRFKRLIIATGAQEIPLVFPNNDLPGIMLSTAALRLVNLYGVSPGKRGVVVVNNDHGLAAAMELLNAGVNVAAVADSRSEASHLHEELRRRGVTVLAPYTVRRAQGTKRVRAAILAMLEQDAFTGDETKVDCDFMAIAAGFDPATSLIAQGDSDFVYDEGLGETVPSKLEDGVSAAGDVTGLHDVTLAILQGKVAGLQAVVHLRDGESGRASEELAVLEAELSAREQAYRRNLAVSPVLVSPEPGGKKFVCVCEDVTEKDIHWAIEEGFDEVQTLKRYSTVSMGPCQGKMCLKAFAGICAADTDRSIGETGTTTSRPPAQPVPMGVVGGAGHMPFRFTPIHHRHISMGAKIVEIGEWKRPHSYGPPNEEVRAVRERVGIIDVSTLGKLEVRGKDAPWLMDRVYTHHFSNLRVGRVRYGIICSDAGVIMDDGTVTRLEEDRYYVTTGTGNIDMVEQWFRWWSAGTGRCVHVTNVTPGLAAINVAGPNARQTLRKLTEVDLSTSAFRYMNSAYAEVAGVPALLMRIGFVGETGWEIHVASEYGEHLWDALLDAGREYDIMPFGVEAQRVLRLEKKHIIPGQDTDVVSNPIEADLSWAVRFDKEDFIGRHALKAIQDRGIRNKLVGFVMENDDLPQDGVPVIKAGLPVGKVTSSRRSPNSQKGFGLAWVPVELAEEGTSLDIQVNGRTSPATVRDAPVYDPEGERLRE